MQGFNRGLDGKTVYAQKGQNGNNLSQFSQNFWVHSENWKPKFSDSEVLTPEPIISDRTIYI